MDSDLLYDEFGNYIGPELASDDSAGSESDSGSDAGGARRNVQDDDDEMGDEDGMDDDQVNRFRTGRFCHLRRKVSGPHSQFSLREFL